VEGRAQHPSLVREYRLSNRCADVFSKFAGEKAEVRFIAARSAKLPKSRATSNGKQVSFYEPNKFKITSVLGLR
jgi:hypothetical protein